MRVGRPGGALLAAVALCAAASNAAAQNDSAWVRARYAKREVEIPMRDGTRLFTSIYTPRDTTRRYPIMMSRSPYGVAPYGADLYRAALGPSARFAEDGYIFVYQDTRGRFMSGGTYAYMTPHDDRAHPNVQRASSAGRSGVPTDESSDSYDTIEWLVRNVAHNNGRVGTWGISAPGFFIAAGMIDAHPAHRAASPQAPLIDWYMGDDRHHNGALTLAQTFNFLSNFARPRQGPVTDYGPRPEFGTPDGYRFFLEMGPVSNANARYFKGERDFWNEIMAHPNYDAFWQRRSIDRHLKDIRPAVLVVGGWFDGEDMYGPLAAARALDAGSPRTERTLVMGPWTHGSWSRAPGDAYGALRFGAKTGVFYRDSVEFPFFACKLKDRCDTPALPRALVFETGANRWHRFDSWPPKGATPLSLTLGAGGTLAVGNAAPGTTAGGSPTAAPATGYDSWVSDPAKPVPYTAATSFGYFRDYLGEDQRFAWTRPDVLSYESAPLDQDVTVVGPIEADVHIATSGTDADVVVKLIDVYPTDFPDPPDNPPAIRMGGYQQLVRGDLMRARFRDSFERPQPMQSNVPVRVRYTMPDAFHTFRKGHRIMVQVQGSWFPLIDRNPQTYVPNINEARASDFRAATMRLYHEPGHESRVIVRTLATP